MSEQARMLLFGNILSVVSNVVAGQTLPNASVNRPVIRQDDWEYLGAFRLPTFACGYDTALAETPGPARGVKQSCARHAQEGIMPEWVPADL
jgi:hypothetical protein